MKSMLSVFCQTSIQRRSTLRPLSWFTVECKISFLLVVEVFQHVRPLFFNKKSQKILNNISIIFLEGTNWDNVGFFSNLEGIA